MGMKVNLLKPEFFNDKLEYLGCHHEVVSILLTSTETSVSSLLTPPSQSSDDGPPLAATDGGAKLSKITFGWTIRAHLVDVATCFGPVHGHKSSNYRAECCGLMSLLTYLDLLCSHYPVLDNSCSLTIHIDNSALLKRVS